MQPSDPMVLNRGSEGRMRLPKHHSCGSQQSLIRRLIFFVTNFVLQ